MIKGEKELERNLKKIDKKTNTQIEDALVFGGLKVERDYKLNVNKAGLVDTGRWIGSITHRKNDFGTPKPSVQIGAAIKDPPYPTFHEFGTSRFPASRPLTRAYNQNKRAILKELAKALKRGTGL